MKQSKVWKLVCMVLVFVLVLAQAPVLANAEETTASITFDWLVKGVSQHGGQPTDHAGFIEFQWLYGSLEDKANLKTFFGNNNDILFSTEGGSWDASPNALRAWQWKASLEADTILKVTAKKNMLLTMADGDGVGNTWCTGSYYRFIVENAAGEQKLVKEMKLENVDISAADSTCAVHLAAGDTLYVVYGKTETGATAAMIAEYFSNINMDSAAYDAKLNPFYKEPEQPAYDAIRDVLAATEGEFTIEGEVTFIDGKTIYVQDATGAMAVYFAQGAPACKIGDKIVVKGTRGEYNKLQQLQASKDDATVTEQAPTIQPIAGGVEIIAEANRYYLVHLTGSFKVTEIFDNNGQYANPNITIELADGKTIQLYKAPKIEGLKVGDTITEIVALLSNHKDNLQLRCDEASDIQFKAAEPEIPENTTATMTFDWLVKGVSQHAGAAVDHQGFFTFHWLYGSLEDKASLKPFFGNNNDALFSTEGGSWNGSPNALSAWQWKASLEADTILKITATKDILLTLADPDGVTNNWCTGSYYRFIFENAAGEQKLLKTMNIPDGEVISTADSTCAVHLAAGDTLYVVYGKTAEGTTAGMICEYFANVTADSAAYDASQRPVGENENPDNGDSTGLVLLAMMGAACAVAFLALNRKKMI